MLHRVALVVMFFVLSAGPLAAAEGAKEAAGDAGGRPWVVDIEKLTVRNGNFRASHWTGQNLQLTVMSINPRGESGREVHEAGDQFIRVEQGRARVVMGPSRDKMTFDKRVSKDWAIFIPAGFWHNIINVGDRPLKVYVIYAPPEHPAGTVHKTFGDAEVAHGH